MISIRTIVICILASQISTASFGQNTGCDSIYVKVDEAPMFMNGYDNLAFYISNLDYGNCAIGKAVILTWTIDRSGQMIDIDAIGLNGECKDHVIGQLAKFPTWSPARIMGIPVCFKIKFRKEG